MGVNGNSADQTFPIVEVVVELRGDRIEHLDRLGVDIGPNTVARQNRYLCLQLNILELDWRFVFLNIAGIRVRSQPAIDLVIRPTLQRAVIAGAIWTQSRLSRRRPAARLTGPLFCIFVFCTRSRLHRSRPARTHPVHLYCIFTFFGRDSVSSDCVRRQGWIAVCFAFFIFGWRASASR